MRTITCFGLLALGFAAIAFSPTVTMGQGKKGNRGGFGGGGFDAGSYFDRIANGKASMAVSEVRTPRRDDLVQFVRERGITNGQITRQQYIEFADYLKAKATTPSGAQNPGGRKNGGFGGNPNGGGLGGNPGGFQIQGLQGVDMGNGKKFKMDFNRGGGGPGGPRTLDSSDAFNPDIVNKWADGEFRKKDANGDGKLNKDEMPQGLRDNLARWDRNGDGFISQEEYREYYMNRVQGDDRGAKGIASIIIQEDELDRKPVVFRVGGTMPTNLPPWFKELDTSGDSDGQVALWEWRKGGKALEDFSAWDLNDDGFITPEEAMRQQNILVGVNPNTGDTGTLAEGDRPSGNGFGNGKNGGGFRGFSANPNGNGGMPGFNPGGFGNKGGNKGFGGFGKGGGKKGKKTGGFGQ